MWGCAQPAWGSAVWIWGPFVRSLGRFCLRVSLLSLHSPHSGSKQDKQFVRGEPQGQGDSSGLQASGVEVPLPETGFCCKVNKQLHKLGVFLGSVEETLWHSCDPLGCVVLVNLPEPLFPWQVRMRWGFCLWAGRRRHAAGAGGGGHGVHTLGCGWGPGGPEAHLECVLWGCLWAHGRGPG